MPSQPITQRAATSCVEPSPVIWTRAPSSVTVRPVTSLGRTTSPPSACKRASRKASVRFCGHMSVKAYLLGISPKSMVISGAS